MKLRIVFLPLLLIAIFGYATATASRVTNGGTEPLKRKAFVEQVKKDFSPVTPLDYGKLNN